MPNPDEINDPTTTINMGLIAQLGMNMVGGIQNVYNAIQNAGNQNGNGNVVVALAKKNGNGNNEIEEVSANCILMANLQQASSSDTQVDKASIYDLDGSAEVPKPVPNSKQRFHLLHMDLCRPMRVKSINGKWYVLVIVDDYSRYTWVHFLRSKDDTPEVIKTSLKKTQSIQPKDKEDHGDDERLDLTYASSIITSQKPTKRELELLFEAMYDDYIGVQPLVAPRTALAAPANQNHQTPNASTTVKESALTPTNSSSQSPNILNTSQDIDELPQ
ncbi:retrovirus-related pol polyprotein from transposon TNT 1-94 [Tanacetum coccineum]